ncbi:MAG: T9SS type A sorting domain-containing protein [Carboxylicivirga sp.]|jgi:hypothetical protein|nr:T9SS type A sorting domain-containing protein [Carboxylicivirga sp.]
MRKFLLLGLCILSLNVVAQELNWSGAEFDNIKIKNGGVKGKETDKGTVIKGVSFTDDTYAVKHFYIRLDKGGINRGTNAGDLATNPPANWLTIEKQDGSTTSINGSGLQIRYKSLYKYELMFKFKDGDNNVYKKIVSFPVANDFIDLSIDLSTVPLDGTDDQFCDFSGSVDIKNFTLVFEAEHQDDYNESSETSSQYDQVTSKKEFIVESIKAGNGISTAIGDVETQKGLIDHVVTNAASCRLYFTEATPKTVSVYTLTGSQMKAISTNDNVLDVILPTGMYIVAVKEGGIQETRKILCK